MMLIRVKNNLELFLMIIVVLGLFVQSSVAQDMDQTSPKSGYITFLSAQASGNLDQFNKTITPSKIKKDPSPEELKMFSSLAQLTPTNLQITNENVTGDKANLTVSGFVPICEGNGDGTVSMMKENGVWKVDTESWKVVTELNGETQTCTFGFGIDTLQDK